MKTINIQKSSLSISDFISWLKDGVLELNPDFQRRQVWTAGQKSYLIDTIVKGFPMPVIFIRERKPDLNALKTTKEVVDGQQRLRTILSYVVPNFLKDYNSEKDYFVVKENHNKEIAKKKFSELQEETRQYILEYKFDVHILPSYIEDRDILQIFSRMNATGIKLNSQEIRNALYTGYFKTLSYDLALEQLERWRNWKIFTPMQIARMLEVEFVSELLTTMLNKKVVGRSQPVIESFYKKYEEDKLTEAPELTRRFRHIMDSIEDLFNTEKPQSILTQKTLFYPLFLLLYDLQFGFDTLKDKKKRPNRVSKEKANKIEKLGNLIAQGDATRKAIIAYQKNTTNVKMRTILFNYLKNKS